MIARRTHHALHCLLVGIIQLLPSSAYTAHRNFRSPLGENLSAIDRIVVAAPSIVSQRCDVDDIATWVTSEDLERLVTALAVREGQSPIELLAKIEASLTSRNPVGETGGHMRNLDLDLPSIRDLLESAQEAPPPLPPPMDSQLPRNDLFPPINFPLKSNGEKGVAVQGRHLPPLPSMSLDFKNLLPPANVKVSVDFGEFPRVSLPSVSLTISPHMRVGEALIQAASEFKDKYPPSKSNNFQIAFGQNKVSQCYFVKGVGNLYNSNNRVWKVTVRDASGKSLFSGRCLPNLGEVEVLPGMSITLRYARKGRS